MLRMCKQSHLHSWYPGRPTAHDRNSPRVSLGSLRTQRYKFGCNPDKTRAFLNHGESPIAAHLSAAVNPVSLRQASKVSILFYHPFLSLCEHLDRSYVSQDFDDQARPLDYLFPGLQVRPDIYITSASLSGEESEQIAVEEPGVRVEVASSPTCPIAPVETSQQRCCVLFMGIKRHPDVCVQFSVHTSADFARGVSVRISL